MKEHASTANATQTVLVVDDNVMSRTVIERTLTRDGHDVVVAGSGGESLCVVNRQSVDLIFLDLVMEGMSGMDVLKELKADARYRHIPVVIISGREDAGIAADCKRAGASAFLNKPVMAATLKETIADTLDVACPPACNSNVSALGTDGGSCVGSVPVFDPSCIEQLIKDYGKKTAACFITQFKELAHEQKAAIAVARDTASISAWSRAAHDLKGGAKAMGLSRLAEVSHDIEFACNEDQIDKADKLSAELDEYFEEALTVLVHAFDSRFREP